MEGFYFPVFSLKFFFFRYLFIVGTIINNEKKLCRAFDRLLKPETYSNYVTITLCTARVNDAP